jgi:hypothetical protein
MKIIMRLAKYTRKARIKYLFWRININKNYRHYNSSAGYGPYTIGIPEKEAFFYRLF